MGELKIETMRHVAIAVLAGLKRGAPKYAPAIDDDLVTVWEVAFTKARCSRDDLLQAVGTYVARCSEWPGPAPIIAIGEDAARERYQQAKTAAYLEREDTRALPGGQVTAEMRAEARARIGLTESEERAIRARKAREDQQREGGMSFAGEDPRAHPDIPGGEPDGGL